MILREPQVCLYDIIPIITMEIRHPTPLANYSTGGAIDPAAARDMVCRNPHVIAKSDPNR